MLICTRCNTSKIGNRPTNARCECGGQYAVIRDGRGSDEFESDGPKELFFGDNYNSRFPKQRVTLSHNRKAVNRGEGIRPEGVDYGKSNVLEM